MSLTPTTPIVVFGDDWGRHVSTMQWTFRHLLDRYPVIWVNGIGHRVPQVTRRDLRRAWEKVRKASGPASAVSLAPKDGVRPRIVLDPRVLPWHHWPGVHRANTAMLMHLITKALRSLGTSERPVLVTGSPPSVGVVERMEVQASLYFCMDDFLHHPSATAWMIEPLEKRLLDCVDGVVATAEHLLQLKRPRSGYIRHLPQGVNYEHFALPQDPPPELRDLPRPLIGFAGRVSDCCDYEILRAVAQRFSNGSVVLVGPVSVPEEQLRPIRLPNVHLLGARPYTQLPRYVQQFDVGMIPYILSGWTISVNPLKFLEYLAAGVPVVSTPLPEVARYEPDVGIGADPAAFAGAIERTLAADRGALRSRGQALASQHTWSTRADTLVGVLNELVSRRREAVSAA